MQYLRGKSVSADVFINKDIILEKLRPLLKNAEVNYRKTY